MGLVLKSTGSWYEVLADGVRYQCRIRGKLRLKGVRSTNPVVVGDWVKFEADEQGGYVISAIEPRHNYIIRRASNLSKESHIIAANIDQALLVVTLFSPETALEFVDRFLVTCEAYKVPVTILLAKIDLARQHPEAVEEFYSIYEKAGYKIVEVSATEGEGIETVRELLRGKTTLLSLMAGLDLPTEGDIIVDGKSTRDWDRNQLRRDAVSVIYQNYNLFPLLTVQENIQYPRNLKKTPRKEALVLAREVRERVELSATYDKRLPSHLSGGEQQRVAIARTLAQGCKIILADEPTGNLDSGNSRNIVEILCRLAHEDGCTVIIVTHDPAVAEQADVVLQMKDGSWI